MKKFILLTNKIIAGMLLTILLFSCAMKKTAELSSASPDGNSTITISGTKNFGDPWQAAIKINAFKQDRQVSTEIYADDLNEKNIKFNWTDNNHCIITINQQDDTKRTFVVEASEDKIGLMEQ
jgi:hypothetical protein